MTSPRQTVEEQLAELDRDLRAIEFAHERPKPEIRLAKPAPKLIGAGERLFRKILLSVILVWSAIIFGMMVRNNSWTLMEWILAPIFMLACALLMYGITLFQIELGKSVWSALRKRND